MTNSPWCNMWKGQSQGEMMWNSIHWGIYCSVLSCLIFTMMGLIFLSSKNEIANTPLGVSREIYSTSIDIYVCEYYLIDSWPTKTAQKARRSSFFCSNYLSISLTSWHFLCLGGSFMFPSFVLSLNSTLMEDMPHFSIISFWFYVC